MIDFNARLKSLKDRRQGTRVQALFDSLTTAEALSGIANGRDVRKAESYEQLKESPGIKYAIGAMAPVDAKSTEISKKEGDRVADNVIGKLTTSGENVEKRIQGSVALDVHIMGYSDVDMLVIVYSPILVEQPKVNPEVYSPSSDPRTCINIVKDVRNKSEKFLTSGFPAATVDCTGNKSIALEGGSLARKVDIVPAIWFDSRAYQESPYEFLRGVDIYHKRDHKLIRNYPFKHIALVNVEDNRYKGNLKRVTRLMKNVVADMPDYKKSKAKKLSSYDLTAIAYNMEQRLDVPDFFRLSLVEKTREYLTFLLSNGTVRNGLIVPDGTRRVFDNEAKVEALEILSAEISDLTKAITKEINPWIAETDSSPLMKKVVR